MAQSGILAPAPQQYFDNNGNPLSGGLLFFYAPGTTTKQSTWTTSDVTAATGVANANPVVCDSAGRVGAIYLDPNLGYKLVIAPSTDTDPPAAALDTQDNYYLPSMVLPQVLTKTFAQSPYTVLLTDGANLLVLADATNGNVTIAPYTAVGHTGALITVMKTDTSANTVTIDPAGAVTWGGAATLVLSVQYAASTGESDGSNWQAISGFGGSQTFNVVTLTSGQLVFPAVQVASTGVNTLDDYEEGSWTPVIGGSGGTSGQTYAEQVGRYVKVGKDVTCWGRARLSVLGTITTNVQIQGLPFAADATSGYRFAGTIGQWESTTTAYVWLSLEGVASATAMTVQACTAAATGTVAIAQANLTANTGFTFTVKYMAAA